MELIRHVVEMCRSRLWLLYWVRTQILRMLPLARLDSAKSISRYRPPNGTAGFARSAVSGLRRVPAPPAGTMPRTDLTAMPGPPKTLTAAYGGAAQEPCSRVSGGTGKSSPGGAAVSSSPDGGAGGGAVDCQTSLTSTCSAPAAGMASRAATNPPNSPPTRLPSDAPTSTAISTSSGLILTVLDMITGFRMWFSTC